MEQTKQSLAALIDKIIESFPDENNLKDFPGISKALIINSLKQIDSTVTALKEFDNSFETILLKRQLPGLFEKINNELKNSFDKIKGSQFNSLLNDIAKIKFLVTETYYSLVNILPIRTEAEVLRASEELTSLTTNIEVLKRINIELDKLKNSTIENSNRENARIATLKDAAITEIQTAQGEIEKYKNSAREIAADLDAKRGSFNASELKITESLAKIESDKIAVDAIQQKTTQWQEDILTAKTKIEVNETEYSALNKKSKELQLEIEATHEKIFGKKDGDGKETKGYFQETEDLKNNIASFLKDQETKFSAQFDEIKGLLPGATSVGLAQAYQTQKESYDIPIRNWSWVFVGTLTIMTILACVLLYIQFFLKQSGPITINDAIISFLKDLPFFIPTIWLAAHASKQQSQNKRLQQEYAFKETNARSFHGHKMQIEQLTKDGEADKELLSQLVAQLVVITAENPSATLDNKSHEDSSPLFKLIEKYTPSFRKNKPNA
jgi:predicted  nucleic acid-binding Zn-ribbon protein